MHSSFVPVHKNKYFTAKGSKLMNVQLSLIRAMRDFKTYTQYQQQNIRTIGDDQTGKRVQENNNDKDNINKKTHNKIETPSQSGISDTFVTCDSFSSLTSARALSPSICIILMCSADGVSQPQQWKRWLEELPLTDRDRIGVRFSVPREWKHADESTDAFVDSRRIDLLTSASPVDAYLHCIRQLTKEGADYSYYMHCEGMDVPVKSAAHLLSTSLMTSFHSQHSVSNASSSRLTTYITLTNTLKLKYKAQSIPASVSLTNIISREAAICLLSPPAALLQIDIAPLIELSIPRPHHSTSHCISVHISLVQHLLTFPPSTSRNVAPFLSAPSSSAAHLAVYDATVCNESVWGSLYGLDEHDMCLARYAYQLSAQADGPLLCSGVHSDVVLTDLLCWKLPNGIGFVTTPSAAGVQAHNCVRWTNIATGPHEIPSIVHQTSTLSVLLQNNTPTNTIAARCQLRYIDDQMRLGVFALEHIFATHYVMEIAGPLLQGKELQEASTMRDGGYVLDFNNASRKMG